MGHDADTICELIGLFNVLCAHDDRSALLQYFD